MAKIGRNAPCPCGSGKKYKHCCYANESVQSGPAEPYANDPEWSNDPEALKDPEWSKDPEWLRIRQAEGEIVPEVLKFALSHYEGNVFETALDEFSLWGEYEIDDIHLENIFFPWLAFNWIPEFEETEPAEPEPRPVGLEYLDEYEQDLDQYQQAFIREACAQPYSFFVITNVRAGESLGLRDIFLPRTLTIKEATASKTLKRGDIVFSRVVELEGQAIMLGMAPIGLPPSCHHLILDARDDFKKKFLKDGAKLDQRFLLEHDFVLRPLYLELVELLSNPPLPDLRNTDGDPIEFVKLYFKLDCPPEEALAALKSLALPEFQDQILADATLDASGNLTEATFGWHKRGNKTQKSWDNTTLGTLTIKGNALTAEVNSEKRAKKIKSEIAKRLKERVVFQKAVHESVESKLEEMKDQIGSPAWEKERKEQEQLQSRPEVKAILKKHIEAHWEAWYNEPIPALNNQTPLQSARTKSGRERLEALLLEYERNNERVDPYLRVDVAAMRKRLRLSS